MPPKKHARALQKKLKKPPVLMKRPGGAVINPRGNRHRTAPPEWRVTPGGTDMPQWAPHWVNVLRDHLDGLVGTTLTPGTTLNVWSDCGGLSSEMFALGDIVSAIEKHYGVLMGVKLYCFCDTDPHCRDMAVANHGPVHVSDDINNRNFDDGTFECSKCCATHMMPTAGLDAYVCCFPCGPWSKSGKRLGFDDDDGNLCWQAIASIKHMQPNIYVMENVVAIGDQNELGESDLDVIKAHMALHLPGYVHLVITGIDPTLNGFPVRKARTLLVGGRSEVITLCNSYITLYIESNSLTLHVLSHAVIIQNPWCLCLTLSQHCLQSLYMHLMDSVYGMCDGCMCYPSLQK